MKKLVLVGAAALCLFAAGAAAQQPNQTIQQQFDAAAVALDAENWTEALRILEALERRVVPMNNARTLAVIRLRQGQAMLRLDRLEDAATILGANLPLLPAGDASLNEDRFMAYGALGRIAELRLQYRMSAQNYRAAAAIEVEPAVKLTIYRGLVQTLMFDDAPAALAAADEGLRVAAEVAPGERSIEGRFRTSRGRVLLNMGRFAEAREELELATRRLGGLGLTVDLRDLVARSDLAIAALLAGDAESARRYLSLTGAGRMRRAALPHGGRTPLPPCGDGLSPNDVAVVELAIRDDGTVASASPVYSSVQGEAAMRFARTAFTWAWTPEEVRPIAALFRSAVRVELRCTRAANHAIYPLEQTEEVARWSAERGIALELLPGLSRTIPQIRADLAAAETQHGSRSPQLLSPLLRLAARDDVPDREQVELLRRALTIARAAAVPGPYRGMIARTLATALHRAGGGSSDTSPDYVALLRDPEIAADNYVAAALHIAAYDTLFRLGRTNDAAAALAGVQATQGMGVDHPLHRQFVERTVALQAARGNAEAAATAYRSLPEGSFRCEAGAHRQRGWATGDDFPGDARIWGFEGWTINEAQISADGRPAPVRTVTSYPPFVFNQASDRIIGRMRFMPAFVPPSGPCTTFLQRIVYRLPEG